MKRKQIINIGIFVFVLLVAGLVYDYTFNSEHRDIANEEATLSISARQLYSEFLNNEQLATTIYLDKVIEIDGKVTASEDNEVVLSDQIQVSFNPEAMPKTEDGTPLTIKGRCVGYDELLEMVKIDQATIINKH